jgi:hypothetical protein
MEQFDPSQHPEQWAQHAERFVQTIDEVLALRKECNVTFGPGAWHADCGGTSLSERVRQTQVSSKDRYRRLLSRVRQLPVENVLQEREVQFAGKPTVGLMLADMAAHTWENGWTVSFAIPNSSWLASSIAAQRLLLLQNGDIEGPTDCTIGHVSSTDHVAEWRTKIQDWGMHIAESSVLDMLGAHPIVMYSAPLEHEPPHVHLLESANSHNTLAKYRIDVVTRIDRPRGPATWDTTIKTWINDHRDQLLRSWERCQRGGHPYKLVPIN